MSKFAIYTKWHWPNGIPSIEDAEKNMKEFSDFQIKLTQRMSYGGKQMIIITNQLSFFLQKKLLIKRWKCVKTIERKALKNIKFQWLRSL